MALFYKNLSQVFIIIFLLIFNVSITAQSQIKGKVTATSGEPLGYTNILLLQAKDSSFLKGEIAGDDGGFLFKGIPEGEYLCKYSMVGYPDEYSKIFKIDTSTPEIDLVTTIMEESITLEGVEIVAKRAFLEQKIDRTVVNVSNTIANAGGNALEVLTRSPGIQVNRLSRTISLVGKEGIVVMINGQIARIPNDAVVQLLEGMNADNIDRIELIHTPPANFEAQGNAGIINIVLKSTGDEGLNGSYSLNIGRGRGDKYGGSLNFNFRKKAVNLFGSYDLKYNLNPQLFTNYRGLQQGIDFLETDTKSQRNHTPTTGQNIRLGADFQLTKNTVLGVLTTFLDRNWYMEAFNTASYLKNGKLDSTIEMPNTETNHARSYTANINLTHKFSTNQSINFDADIVSYKINNPSNYDIKTINVDGNSGGNYELRIDKKTPINFGVIKLDYTLDISKNLKLEAGAKYTATGFNNDVIVDSSVVSSIWVNLSHYTSYSTLKENILGSYATFSGKINDATEFKAGIRREYTNSNLSAVDQPNIVDRHYPSWFPSLFLNHKISDHQSVNLSYSRRITRPGLLQMAAFLVFSDPTTLLGGNPAIQPSFTNALKFDYTHKSVRFGLSYSVEKDPIGIVPTVDAMSNRQINSWQNLIDTKVGNANIYIPLNPTSWYSLTSNFFMNTSKTNFMLENMLFVIQNFNYGFNINNSVNLPKKFVIEVSGNYNSAAYWGVAKSRANGSLNVGIQKSLPNNWGNIRFTANDLLISSNWYLVTNQPEVNLLVNSSFRFAERVFMLTWNNTFGNSKLKSTRSRQTGSAEEIRRI